MLDRTFVRDKNVMFQYKTRPSAFSAFFSQTFASFVVKCILSFPP